MSKVNYDAMSDRELKQYFLAHKDDKAALQAYLDRRNQQPRKVITKIGDPDFDTKLQAAILQQMQDYGNNKDE